MDGRRAKPPRSRPGAAAPMSLRAYAKRRGCSPEAVSKAISTGRLSASVVRVRGVPKIGNAEAADLEWDATTDYTRAPGRAPSALAAPPGEPRVLNLQEQLALEKYWKAKLAELEYRRRVGELVEVKDVTAKLITTITTCRTKLLGVPSRARQALPNLSVQDVVVLEDLVREALEELAAAAADVEAEGATDGLAPAPPRVAAG